MTLLDREADVDRIRATAGHPPVRWVLAWIAAGVLIGVIVGLLLRLT